MNPLAKLEQLNLEPAAKIEVTAMLQALMDQTTADAKLIQAKDDQDRCADTRTGLLQAHPLQH